MNNNLQQLREAIDKGLVGESYMLEYTQHMHDIEYSTLVRYQIAPPEPSIEQLSYSGLHAACLATSLHPPMTDTADAIDAARTELNRLNVRWQLDLTLYMCTAAYNDIRWLSEQSVHGAGSVVRFGIAKEIAVIVRPEALRIYNGGNDSGV